LFPLFSSFFFFRGAVSNETGVSASNRQPTEPESPAPGPDDLELVARCQRGDTEAYNELVTRYRSRAFAMIYHMVRNEQDAWDLAQDGFLKAWKNIGRFRGPVVFLHVALPHPDECRDRLAAQKARQ
jgi:hypothetical protein